MRQEPARYVRHKLPTQRQPTRDALIMLANLGHVMWGGIVDPDGYVRTVGWNLDGLDVHGETVELMRAGIWKLK